MLKPKKKEPKNKIHDNTPPMSPIEEEPSEDDFGFKRTSCIGQSVKTATRRGILMSSTMTTKTSMQNHSSAGQRLNGSHPCIPQARGRSIGKLSNENKTFDESNRIKKSQSQIGNSRIPSIGNSARSIPESRVKPGVNRSIGSGTTVQGNESSSKLTKVGTSSDCKVSGIASSHKLMTKFNASSDGVHSSRSRAVSSAPAKPVRVLTTTGCSSTNGGSNAEKPLATFYGSIRKMTTSNNLCEDITDGQSCPDADARFEGESVDTASGLEAHGDHNEQSEESEGFYHVQKTRFATGPSYYPERMSLIRAPSQRLLSRLELRRQEQKRKLELRKLLEHSSDESLNTAFISDSNSSPINRSGMPTAVSDSYQESSDDYVFFDEKQIKTYNTCVEEFKWHSPVARATPSQESSQDEDYMEMTAVNVGGYGGGHCCWDREKISKQLANDGSTDGKLHNNLTQNGNKEKKSKDPQLYSLTRPAYTPKQAARIEVGTPPGNQIPDTHLSGESVSKSLSSLRFSSKATGIHKPCDPFRGTSSLSRLQPPGKPLYKGASGISLMKMNNSRRIVKPPLEDDQYALDQGTNEKVEIKRSCSKLKYSNNHSNIEEVKLKTGNNDMSASLKKSIQSEGENLGNKPPSNLLKFSRPSTGYYTHPRAIKYDQRLDDNTSKSNMGNTAREQQNGTSCARVPGLVAPKNLSHFHKSLPAVEKDDAHKGGLSPENEGSTDGTASKSDCLKTSTNSHILEQTSSQLSVLADGSTKKDTLLKKSSSNPLKTIGRPETSPVKPKHVSFDVSPQEMTGGKPKEQPPKKESRFNSLSIFQKKKKNHNKSDRVNGFGSKLEKSSNILKESSLQKFLSHADHLKRSEKPAKDVQPMGSRTNIQQKGKDVHSTDKKNNNKQKTKIKKARFTLHKNSDTSNKSKSIDSKDKGPCPQPTETTQLPTETPVGGSLNKEEKSTTAPGDKPKPHRLSRLSKLAFKGLRKISPTSENATQGTSIHTNDSTDSLGTKMAPVKNEMKKTVSLDENPDKENSDDKIRAACSIDVIPGVAEDQIKFADEEEEEEIKEDFVNPPLLYNSCIDKNKLNSTSTNNNVTERIEGHIDKLERETKSEKFKDEHIKNDNSAEDCCQDEISWGRDKSIIGNQQPEPQVAFHSCEENSKVFKSPVIVEAQNSDPTEIGETTNETTPIANNEEKHGITKGDHYNLEEKNSHSNGDQFNIVKDWLDKVIAVKEIKDSCTSASDLELEHDTIPTRDVGLHWNLSTQVGNAVINSTAVIDSTSVINSTAVISSTAAINSTADNNSNHLVKPLNQAHLELSLPDEKGCHGDVTQRGGDDTSLETDNKEVVGDEEEQTESSDEGSEVLPSTDQSGVKEGGYGGYEVTARRYLTRQPVSSSGAYPTPQGGLRVTDGADGAQRNKQMRGERRHTVDGAQIEQAIMSKTDEDLVRQREAFFGHLAKKYPEHAQKITGHSTSSLPRQQHSSSQYPRQHSADMPDTRYSTLPVRPGSADVYRRNVPTQNFIPRRPPGPVYESDVDDPGIMSEAETSATGFNRGGRYRASLPVRTQTRSSTNVGGLVFLVYRGLTRRALLPNEVTHLDTIKALFVRSFPDKLTMQFLNSPWRKIYLLDQNTKGYHQLQDVRQVHDRCVLHLYEDDSGAPLQPSYVPSNVATKVHETNVDDIDMYFSEPEFEAARRNKNIIGRSSSYHANTDLTRQVRPPSSLPLNNDYTPPSQQPAYTPPSPHHNVDYVPSYQQDGVRSGASTPDPETRNRMSRMEAQLANLTAWVRSSRSRTGSESDHGSEGSYTPRSTEPVHSKPSATSPAGISDGSCSTPQPTLSVELQEKIKDVHKQTKDLKSEYKNLKRIHEAQAETMRETIRDTFNKIIGMLQTVPGADDHPVRSLRQKTNVKLNGYKQEVHKLTTDLDDLESSVEELRGDVINKRCRVNMDEVESMALALSKITKTLAELKGQFPKVAQDLKSAMSGEVEIVVRQERYLKEEPNRLEDTLKKCKKLTGTLFTLKRLASVQEHRPITVPDMQTLSNPEEQEKKVVFDNIQALVPDHESRQQKIQEAEQSRERKKKLVANKETLKFEKSLEMASKSLKQAESLPKAEVSKEPLVKKSKDGVHTYQGHVMNQDTGKVQERKDDIMFIDGPDEMSIQMDASQSSAFTRVSPSGSNVTIPSSTYMIPSSPTTSFPPMMTSTPYNYTDETSAEKKVVKSHVSPSSGSPSKYGTANVQSAGSLIRESNILVPSAGSPVKQGTMFKQSAGSPTKQSTVHVQLTTSLVPPPPVRSSSRSFTSHVDMVPTKDERFIHEKRSSANGTTSQQVRGQSSQHKIVTTRSSLPVSMTTSYTTNVTPQRPRPRQISVFQQDVMQGLCSNMNRPDLQDQKTPPSKVLASPDRVTFQDLPEHLSSDDSDTDSVNSQDSQEAVNVVPKSKTTDELIYQRSHPPPPMPRSSSLSRAQIIQHTNQVRNKKSLQLRDEYLKLQKLQKEYRVKKDQPNNYVPQTNGNHKEPLVTTI